VSTYITKHKSNSGHIADSPRIDVSHPITRQCKSDILIQPPTLVHSNIIDAAPLSPLSPQTSASLAPVPSVIEPTTSLQPDVIIPPFSPVIDHTAETPPLLRPRRATRHPSKYEPETGRWI
jgi:hypothetical protein